MFVNLNAEIALLVDKTPTRNASGFFSIFLICFMVSLGHCAGRLHHAAHSAHSAAAHRHWRQVFLDVGYACFCSQQHC